MWLGIGVLTLGAVAAAQVKQEQPSLGAVAKAVQEEKAKTGKGKLATKTSAKSDDAAKAAPDPKTDETTGKQYTNEDLDRRPRPHSPTSSYPTRTRTTSMTKSTDRGADEAYWRRRAGPILERLRDTTERLNEAKAHLENKKAPDGLDVSVANGRSSQAQAERDRLTTYVMQLEGQLRREEQAMKHLEEEGRRAGALPGWFR